MTSCFKPSNNKYSQCPARMADGRHFTDYRPTDFINDLIRADNNISNSLNYRVFLQQNANALMDKQREIACAVNCCTPTPISQQGNKDNKEGFENSTMLPEQYMFVTDGRSSKYVLNDINGIGTGRHYNTFENLDTDCKNMPTGWPSNSDTNKPNQCLSPLDNFNYLGDYNPTPTGLRNAIPGGGTVLNM